MLRGLRRCWRAALGVGILAGVICAALIWLFLPPAKPSAFAKIYFPAVSERTRYEQAEPPLKEQTQKELILSRMILGKVIGELRKLAELETIRERPDPVAWLARELSIEIPTGAEIMKISLQGDRPEELQTIVNTVKDTYLTEIANEAESRRNERENRFALARLLAKAEREYESAVDSMRKKGEGVGSGDPQTIAFMNRRLQEQKDQAEVDLRILRDTLEKNRKEAQSLEKKLTSPIDMADAAFDSIFQTDEEVIVLSRTRKEVERRLTERKRLVAPDHPSIKDIQTDLSNVVHKIDDRRQELRPFLETRVHQKLTGRCRQAAEDIREGEVKEQAIMHRLSKFDGEAKALDSATLNAHGSHKDLLKLKAKVDDYELEVERLRNAREAPIRARTLEEAMIVRPNEAARKTRFALGGFAGILGLTLLGFAFGEYRTRRIASPDEVEHGLGLPVMGTVPAARSRRCGRCRRAVQPPNRYSGNIWSTNRSIPPRTLFLHTADANDLRVVAVTSAVGGEGEDLAVVPAGQGVARSGRRRAADRRRSAQSVAPSSARPRPATGRERMLARRNHSRGRHPGSNRSEPVLCWPLDGATCEPFSNWRWMVSAESSTKSARSSTSS